MTTPHKHSPTDAPATAVLEVLIVEDEFAIALDLESRLEQLGHHVVGIADCYEEALALAAQERPKLVLMDINLRGERTGIEAARAIYAQYEIPIVFLSALGDEKTFSQALGEHAYGYLVKPFKDVDLGHAIRIALQKHQTISANHHSAHLYRSLLNTHWIQPFFIFNEDLQLVCCNYAAEQLADVRNLTFARQPLRLLFPDLLPLMGTLGAEEPTRTTLQTSGGLQQTVSVMLFELDIAAAATQRHYILVCSPHHPNNTQTVLGSQKQLTLDNVVFVKDKSRLVGIVVRDILWVEAFDNYTVIVTEKQRTLVSSTLKDLLEKLPASDFMRIHRSYIVQLGKIKKIEDFDVFLADKPIPVSKSYRDELISRINIL